MTKGPLVTIDEAARLGGVSKETIRIYIKTGQLQTHVNGLMVYYRDLLRASWVAKQRHISSSGKASKNYKKA